ncbi:hypothetical protein B0T24DRAFT_8606 [Lasiosphaeria ovina]|uniref:Uncharacterized protein n=1 Tax=Lasiosphaeria ovina TaxID=92902 RepID=A0AAE0NIW4_9PEZI|nr:hypothetical protein B0T24DRAFT_8606 [Lasiosphaeria ovina]
MSPGGSRSRRSSVRASQPMPMIDEDSTTITPAPAVPPRSPRRPPASIATAGSLPPGGAAAVAAEAEARHRQHGFRDFDLIAKRGGWYRLGLAAIVLVGLTVGLAVGLTLGLRKRNSDVAALPAMLPDIFPAGAYSFTTAYVSKSTACTGAGTGNSSSSSSLPSAWSCYPDVLYDARSPNQSAARFDWIIAAAPLPHGGYTLSSSANPFAPGVANASLTLLDGNQYTERFVFSVATGAKAGTAATATVVSGGESGVECWFNDTVLSATIWTRVRASYPPGIDAVPDWVNATYRYAPWPYAVEVTQTARGPPDCRRADGSAVSAVLSDNDDDDSGSGTTTSQDSATCACVYTNHDLPSNASASSTFTAGRMLRRLRLL